MPSPPSTRPSDATGRRSSAFVHKDTETAAAPSTTTSRARVEGATDGGAGDCCRSPSVSEPATPLAPPRSRRSSAPCEALRHGCDAPGAATKPAEPRKQVSHTQAASAIQLASVACRRWPGDVGGGGLGGLVPARRAQQESRRRDRDTPAKGEAGVGRSGVRRRIRGEAATPASAPLFAERGGQIECAGMATNQQS
jgi:hypothetical protein